jgi:hypothetical protein
LVNNYKWSLEDIENMLFWEREIYINLLAEEKRMQQEMALNRQYSR